MKLRWHLELSPNVDTLKYRKTVEDLVGPIMDWLCERVVENDLTTNNESHLIHSFYQLHYCLPSS